MTKNYKYIFDGDKDYSPFMTIKTINDNFNIGNTKIKLSNIIMVP